MVLKILAGLLLSVILIVFLTRTRPDGITAEEIIRPTAYGIFGALLATMIGLIVGIGGHLKGWRPAGSLISLAFRAWVMKGLIEQAAKFFSLHQCTKNETHLSLNEIVYFGAVIGTAFGFGKGIAELFETGSTFLGVVREILPVHFAAGVWTGFLYAKGMHENNRLYTIAAFVLPALGEGLYEFIVSYHFVQNGLWLIPAVGVLLSAAACGMTVLCMLRWKRMKAMNTVL